MAGSKSDYLENKMLDLVLGNQAYTPPASLYFALYTANPSDSGGGTEVYGNGYARVAVTNNLTNFPAASGGSKQNASSVTWPTATAGWGVITAVGVHDASTAGNLLYWTTISSKTIDSNDTVSIPVNNLTITED